MDCINKKQLETNDLFGLISYFVTHLEATQKTVKTPVHTNSGKIFSPITVFSPSYMMVTTSNIIKIGGNNSLYLSTNWVMLILFKAQYAPVEK